MSLLCVAGLVLVATAATGTAVPAVAFAETGHWIANVAAGTVTHVDGGTRKVDAQVPLPAEIGTPVAVLQGERQGFIVGRKSVAVFGRSTLTVDTTISVDQPEVPVGVEVVGGPYLVYRKSGVVVRLGVPPLTIQAGGGLDRPVWTDDGTLWLHRADNGDICALRRGADRLDCSVAVAPREPGGLTVVTSVPAFASTRSDAAQVVQPGALAAPVGLGTDVAEDGLVADRDGSGRLAVVEQGAHRLVLTDSNGIPSGRSGGPAVPVPLPAGRYSSPVAAGDVVAVLETTTNLLLTFDVTGRQLQSLQLPPGSGMASIVRGGDGRIYVDNADGSATHVVGADGSIATVATALPASAPVAVAAPPERTSPVSLSVPDRRPVGVSTGPVDVGRPIGRGGGGGALDGGSLPGGGNQTLPPRLPDAPRDVVATADSSGVVTVRWRPVVVEGSAVTYSVEGAGGTKNTTRNEIVVQGLQAGQTYTFTVFASASGGRSLGAMSNPVTLVTPAAAPGNFQALRSPLDQARSRIHVALTWDKPNLGGGILVGYSVMGRQGSSSLPTRTVRDEKASYDAEPDFDPCKPVTIEVRALTKAVSASGEISGKVSSTTFQDADCTPSITIRSYSFVTPTDLSVDLLIASTPAVVTNCTLVANGDNRWIPINDAVCGGTADGLQGNGQNVHMNPGVTYSIYATAANKYGSARSQTISVTAPS